MVETNYNITAVIPAYSDISIVNNSVISLCTQWIPNDTFQLEIIIVNDNPDKGNQYDFYLSEAFKKIIKPNIEIRVITNLVNSGQGVSRNVGIDNAKYNWIVLCDEDDMYAVNSLYRIWEILKKEHNSGEDNKPVSIVACPIYSFDKDFYRNIIPSDSIWVNSKLYNKKFLDKYELRFPTDENSHRAEDYPFSRMVDYATRLDDSFKRVDLSQDSDTFYYWYPNPESRSRKDKYYGSLLSGYTMRASVRIYDFIEKFNKTLDKQRQIEEDERLKHTILNMNIYSYYNLLKVLKDISDGYDIKELEWNILCSAIKELQKRLQIYLKEIVPSDIYDELHNVKHHSDIQFVESWIGSFENFIIDHKYINMSLEEIKAYCATLKFDSVNHEIHSTYVEAWKLRHSVD